MIGLVTELLLCILLATSIGYSILLDRRLRLMKADEQTMRKTILDLMTATESAERAVAACATSSANATRPSPAISRRLSASRRT